ncbi:MAG TPA: citrate synthase [Tepidisphaeraceae bacterium]|jgi:citrate synthase
MSRTATLTIDGKTIDLPIIQGTEGELGIDVTKLRDQTGYITVDPGYRNTGSCTSEITFIDAEKGILRYRGYPIEELADKSTFLETASLLIEGKLPTPGELDGFVSRIAEHTPVNPALLTILKGFPQDASPMAMLSACISGLCGYDPEVMDLDLEAHFDITSAKLIAKIRTLAAAIYRHSVGKPAIAPADIPGPAKAANYTAKFLQMMFGEAPKPEVARALDLIFLLHADHEQNCSASTCRMVGSSHANLFASCAAAVCALWGPLHGGANVEIMNQLEQIHRDKIDPDDFLAGVKAKKYRLFGFGHPIYRNYDPRARILSRAAESVLASMKIEDPLLKIARRLEEVALADDYFVSRKLYPNVDFYSGIIMRAMGVPTDMFTVLFAVGRMPGWIAQWKEVRDQKGKIYRPRQIYTGPTGNHYA